MESLKTVSILEIPSNKISYNKKTNVFSVQIADFMFVGNYKKSIRISKILDDIFASLGDTQLGREDVYFIDYNNQKKIHGNTKLKNLYTLDKKKLGKKKSKAKKPTKNKKEDLYDMEEEILGDDDDMKKSAEEGEMASELKELLSSRDEMGFMEDSEMKDKVKEKEKSRSTPPPAPGGGPPSAPASAPTPVPASTPSPAPPPPSSPAPSDAITGPRRPVPKTPAPVTSAPEEPQPTVYEINMGLQYYSVMMEQRSYLFYVYFSHEELKIVDEEGKVVYETTIKIVTTKKEPPVLDLRIEGEGFEVHPLFGKVEVKKDAVNPPVMIFSILPLKSTKKKKKKKETERRFLNAYVDFEGKTISHTILSIIVQPKFFRVDIGPIHLNLSKKTATIISFVSILIAGISLIYTIFSLDPSSGFTDILGGFAPGLGSIIFFAIFIVTLLKEGIYPLKEKISGFLNFDQSGILIK